MTARTARTRTRLAVATVATAFLVAGCANDAKQAAPPPDLQVSLVASLQPFDRCDDFLAYVKEQAAARVGAYGLDGGVYFEGDMPISSSAREDTAAASSDMAGAGAETQSKAVESAPAPATTAAGLADSGAGTDGTGTNNQESGVDEADLVKTDGTRIVTVRGSELVVVTLTGGAPYVTAKVDLGTAFSGDRLFLLPDRAYVLGYESMPFDDQGTSSERITEPMYGGGGAAIVEVSFAGDEPTVAHRTQLQGNILDGRLANGTVRLVLTTPGGAGLGFVYPNGSDERSFDRAAETNRQVLEDSKLDDWLPSAAIDGGKPAPLLDCDHLYRPSEPSGFSMLSILTIADGLGSLTGSGVLADGQTTYASADHLYVATNRWDDTLPDGAVAKRAPGATTQHTDVHSFSIAGTEPAAYEASGRVEGHVLNQYSMSQSSTGDLRIATTVDGGGIAVPMPMPIDCPPDANCPVPMEDTASAEVAAPVGDSRIVVLRQDGDTLNEIGKVGGLGATEQIKSVRYVGDTAYVVTFRQTDPFYVVDLSDPAAPKTLGELKVPGFSSYLHPVGDHLVLGVGSDATDQGRITGAKLSLYDTSDPVNPKELTNWTSRDLGFMVDGDPHAFSWDAERQTAYLPYSSQCFADVIRCSVNSNGVLVVKVADGAITELGRIDHDERTASPPVAPETTTTTTTTPDTTTTVPETTVPETTVPETTVPATTTTTEPVPTTLAERGDTGSGISGSSASGPAIGIAPVPQPDIYCDPAACDPAPIPYSPTITRVFVVGDRIITLSDFGIAAHDVADRHLVGYAAF